MKSGKYFYFLLLLFVCVNAKAQQPLEELLEERDVLYEKYEVYQSQNSSFWGTKSKKDLRKIIETLKEIIRKDTEVVQAVRGEFAKNESQLSGINRETSNRISELENELEKYKRLANRSKRELTELEADMDAVSDNHFKYQFVILLLVILSCVLGYQFYKLKKG